MEYTIGLDLGGTAIKGGLLDADGKVLAQDMIDTEAEQGPDRVFDRLAELAESLRQQADVDTDKVHAVGVGVPGPMTHEGVLLYAPNLAGWRDIPIQQQIAEKMDWPVRVVNDADAAAYGEYWTGTARDESIRYSILLTLGTGVGGGIILDGDIYSGPHGAGAELGHMIVRVNGHSCGCGQRGCLEQYTSASAIAAEARRRIQAGQHTTLPRSPSARDVFDGMHAGDKLASQVVEYVCEYLAVACVNLTRVFDPQMILIGGGVAAAGDALLDRVRTYYQDHTLKIYDARARIELASLGNDAGFIGAAGMTRDL